MQILINTDENLDSRFLIFMESYHDKDKQKIMASIFHIVNNYNGKPVMPTARALFETGEEELFEFRIALSKLLIRINYFIDYENDYLVILNAYEKPNGAKDKNSYNKAKKKELDSMIKTMIDLALDLKKQYFINNKHYELLN